VFVPGLFDRGTGSQACEAVVALGSLQEELARRLAESRQRIVELRERHAEVQSLPDAEEDRLSRLEITRENGGGVSGRVGPACR
jgi:hypothetical protein